MKIGNSFLKQNGYIHKNTSPHMPGTKFYRICNTCTSTCIKAVGWYKSLACCNGGRQAHINHGKHMLDNPPKGKEEALHRRRICSD